MKTPLISVILASALIAMPSLAVSSSSTQFKFDVQVDRSALNDSASVASEYQRIHEQVAQRCQTENRGFNPIRKATAVRNCVRFAMNDVVRRVDHDGLTAHHRRQKSG